MFDRIYGAGILVTAAWLALDGGTSGVQERLPLSKPSPPAPAAEEPDPPAAPPAVSEAEHPPTPPAPVAPEPADAGGPPNALATRTVAAQPVSASPPVAGWVYQQPAQPQQYNPVYWQPVYGAFGRVRGYRPAYRPQMRGCVGGT